MVKMKRKAPRDRSPPTAHSTDPKSRKRADLPETNNNSAPAKRRKVAPRVKEEHRPPAQTSSRKAKEPKCSPPEITRPAADKIEPCPVPAHQKSSRKQAKNSKAPAADKTLPADPSAPYLAAPLSAPTVAAAKAFFLEELKLKKFPVSVPQQLTGWRGVAKLNVRAGKEGELKNSTSPGKKFVCRLGLCAPGSTELVDLVARGSASHAGVLNQAIDWVAHSITAARAECFQTLVKRGGVRVVCAGNGNLDKAVAKTSIAGEGDSSPSSSAGGSSQQFEEEVLPRDPFARVESDSLRYVLLAQERRTQTVQVCFVWNSADFEGLTKNGGALCRLLKSFPHHFPRKKLHSVWLHSNTLSKHNNAIVDFEGRWQCLSSGPRKEKDGGFELRVEGAPSEQPEGTGTGAHHGCREQLFPGKKHSPTLYFPPSVFRQANIKEFAKIVNSIRNFVKPKDRVLEMYGGVGTIGLNLFSVGDSKGSSSDDQHTGGGIASLVCSDANPHNRACFEKSADELREMFDGPQERVEYVPLPATRMVSHLRNKDLVIVDPPRKGLEESVLNALVGCCSPGGDGGAGSSGDAPRRLVYVSCGFKAFQRDCKALMAGGWRLKRAEGFLLFPGADHLETLAFFEREVV